ncbi:hypothetical protein PHLCEN_2v4431 [Hermanssonia centrifuga]|uniref:Major facilitator superfamily (MFS) profile domain-containing protein n=1 Tax=Hermanssonia centrifuga TaxID=98765 RepID=A0A2R6PNL3_9APHY|nr:hypothetical protein PHLCEN_2v4431 [Hermanssonia centrifuga]
MSVHAIDYTHEEKNDGVTKTRSIDAEGGPILAETRDVYDEEESGMDPVYQAKARILNDALQEIGMGKYQIVTSLILTPVVNEFGFEGPFLKLGQNIGLLVGAAFWGVASDIWGRKWAFDLTLFITGVFALAAGASPTYIALCSFAAVWSIGVGGNLPVDSAVFLEFIPASHQYLLTVLSIWWAIGQLVGSLIAWPLIANFSCTGTTPATCPRESNQGWRYFMYTMGGLMLLLWVLRFGVFHLYESPKYLMGRGRDTDAVDIVHKVAAYNGTISGLTVEMLEEAGRLASLVDPTTGNMETSAKAAALRKLRKFNKGHVSSLFATKKLAYSTFLLIVIWVLTGVFLFAGTTARTSDALLGWNCGYTFTSNVMYGVLYAVSPELFPTKDRGTGNAIVATANRVFGIMAPIIALYANLATSVPIYVSGALFLVSGLIALLLPFEPRGKASV